MAPPERTVREVLIKKLQSVVITCRSGIEAVMVEKLQAGEIIIINRSG